MPHYTMMLFNWDDGVETVRTIRARNAVHAARIANVAVLAHPGSAGFQLWQGGSKVVGTYPRSGCASGASLAVRFGDTPRDELLRSTARGAR